MPERARDITVEPGSKEEREKGVGGREGGREGEKGPTFTHLHPSGREQWAQENV